MSEETLNIVPYVTLLEGRDPDAVMRETPATLDALLSNFSAQEIAERPTPDKWSLREVMCHLADCELAWAWRLRQVYGEHNPQLQAFEQDPWARAYGGAQYTFEAARTTWGAVRQWNLALIETFSVADRQRPAVHPAAGPVTLWTLVEIAAGHDLHHLRLLSKKVEAH